ncbi:hypothetical protein BMR1_03g03165 [Babesia microti strain RI]|uniref:Uncharacterized protein n=1 Tax=Babesia microti (strain RI) TaxID=1133968 RepID=A0A0K3ARG4_BABMR|nr:hypothetical protein BMR1_03g03165 [Babesia microti strain RI]CTQ41233.1 hypothetical protein BMR1_03g03165 [Babesia microti strain RI]|eukprot:XP_012649244.1 hypothetical protein BMR1_03g03165 [Babesia microti strain RI]
MGGAVPLSNYISPITNAVSNTMEKLINSQLGYTMLYGIPVIFGLRQISRYNRLAKLRFDDIGYQIRRADSIGNRWIACKYFFVGTVLAPLTGCAIAYKIYACSLGENYQVNKLIFHDITRQFGNGIRIANDIQTEFIRENLTVDNRISESFKRMSTELKQDASKVKSKLGLI